MYHFLVVHVHQSPSNVFELSEVMVSNGHSHQQGHHHTSSNRFASLCALMNSLIFPFSIHSETIANWSLLIVIPRNGSTFGWRRASHVTTSLQNLYTVNVSCLKNNSGRLGEPTLVILAKSLVEYTLNALTATGRPWYSPFHTSANPPRYSGVSSRL